MTDRLTIDQCRVGMRVVHKGFAPYVPPNTECVISDINTRFDPPCIRVDGDAAWWDIGYFSTPADPAPLPAMTAELLAALREWHPEMRRRIEGALITTDGKTDVVLDAIERAGIVQPSPTPDEIAAARQVIERAGMKVTP